MAILALKPNIGFPIIGLLLVYLIIKKTNTGIGCFYDFRDTHCWRGINSKPQLDY